MEVETREKPGRFVDPFEQEDMLLFDLQVDLELASGTFAGSDSNNVETTPVAETEKYGHSLATIRRWGEFLLRGELERPEAKGIERVVYDDFKTKLVEMIKTDPEFRDRLDVEARNEFEIKDGQVRWADGTSFSDMLRRGLESAREAAKVDPRLSAEVERAEGDLHVAEVVDALKPGESYFALSMEPKEELARYSKLYEERGYRKGIAYMQWYSRTSDNKLVAGSFSIDHSNAALWRKVGARIGMQIPEDEAANRYIRHGAKQNATAEEAQEITRALREEYYKENGVGSKRFSISEFVDANEASVRGVFNTYYPQIARAVTSGENNSTLQGFAEGWVNNISSNTSPELINKVWRIALSDRFRSDDGRVLDDALSYAAVERLRKGVARLVRGESLAKISYETRVEQQVYSGMPLEAQFSAMNSMIISSINDGVGAGRVYGGCGGSVAMNRPNNKDPFDPVARQQALFGGLGANQESRESGSEKTKEYKKGVCQVPKCPTRPGITKVGPCSVCIGCEDLDNQGFDLMTVHAGRSDEEVQGFYDIEFDFMIGIEQAEDSSFGNEEKVLKETEVNEQSEARQPNLHQELGGLSVRMEDV